MKRYDVHCMTAQYAARAGWKPHDILRLILTRIEPLYPGHIPYIQMDYCIGRAFRIPLRIVRSIEEWVGFPAKTGTMTDDDLDTLLQPWIDQYLQSEDVTENSGNYGR